MTTESSIFPRDTSTSVSSPQWKRSFLDYVARQMTRYRLGELENRPDTIKVDVPIDREDLDISKWNLLEAANIHYQEEPGTSPHFTTPNGERVDSDRGLAIELVSPFFKLSDWNSATAEIGRVLTRLIGSEEDYPGTNWGWFQRGPGNQSKAWTDDTCSLRVQICSTEEHEYFTLRTLQELVSLWGISEEALKEFGPLQHNLDVLNARSLWHNIPAGLSRKEFQNIVHSTKNVKELQDIIHHINGQSLSKIRFTTMKCWLIDRVNRVCVIEFTEHVGTLDIEDVAFWAGFTVEILRICQQMADDNTRFMDKGPQGRFGFMDLLEWLQPSEESRRYCSERLVREVFSRTIPSLSESSTLFASMTELLLTDDTFDQEFEDLENSWDSEEEENSWHCHHHLHFDSTQYESSTTSVSEHHGKRVIMGFDTYHGGYLLPSFVY